MATPRRRHSLSIMLLPSSMFSSFFSCLRNWRIFALAWGVLQMRSQSLEGPLQAAEVMISTRSPVSSVVSRGTILPLILAPTHLLPTAEWMR